MDVRSALPRTASASAVPQSMPLIALGALVSVLMLALFGRILSAPVRHDEQMFFSMAMMLGKGQLYQDFGFNHLPNSAYLLAPLRWLTHQPFLAARMVICLAWVAASGAMALIALRATGKPAMALLAVLLLITSPLLVNQTGTLVTNNFLPIPFMLTGTLVFMMAVDRKTPDIGLVALSGIILAIAIGMKANYAFMVPPFAIAALNLPAHCPLKQRFRQVFLPMLGAGLLGGLPTLLYLAQDPSGFFAHVVGYHTGPHHAWALQQPGDLIISLPERMALAQGIWGSGGFLLTGFAITVLLVLRGGKLDWQSSLLVRLTACAIVASFIPSPAFAQYYSLPAAFLIVLLLHLAGGQPVDSRRFATPLLIALGIAATAVDAPRLLGGLPALARPAQWTGAGIHRLSTAIVAAAAGRPVATLSPLYVLDAGGIIYPELAAGPFVYRVAGLIPAEDKPHYRLASPQTLPAMLDLDPPGAILVGAEGDLDNAFRSYAQSHGYRAVPLPGGNTRYGALTLFAAPPRYAGISPSSSEPPPNRSATTSEPSASMR